MHSIRATFVLLPALLLAACADSTGDSATLTATRDTVGDTIVVRTLSGSVWGAPRTLVPTLSIGVLDGEDPYIFGSIRGIAVAPDERIFVLDGQVPVVRAYASDGTHLRDIGRAGEGPGEYARPDGGPTLTPDGRLLVRDSGSGKIVVFSTDGEPLDDWRLPYGGSFGTSQGMDRDSAGNVLTPAPLNLGASVTEWKWAWFRFSPEGVVDTIPDPAPGFEPWVVTGESERSSSSNSVPYAPAAHTVYSPLGHFVRAVSSEYRIDQLRPDGTVLRIERDWDPVPVNPDEAAFLRRRIERNMRDQFPGWDWNGPEIPDEKPPFRQILTGEDGRLWVVLSTPSVEVLSAAEAAEEERAGGRPPNRWGSDLAFDVFEPTGEYLGRVDAPDGMTLTPSPVFRGETVWAVTADELGVQRVVRFEARPTP